MPRSPRPALGQRQVRHHHEGRASSGGSVFPGVTQLRPRGEPGGWGPPAASLLCQKVPGAAACPGPRVAGGGDALPAPPEHGPRSHVCCWRCSPPTPAMSAGRPRREDTAAVFLTFAACVSKQLFPREALSASSAHVCRVRLGEGAQASSRRSRALPSPRPRGRGCSPSSP